MFPAQVYLGQGLLHFPAKPVSVEGCTQMYNVSQEFINSVKVPEETIWGMGPIRQVILLSLHCECNQERKAVYSMRTCSGDG